MGKKYLVFATVLILFSMKELEPSTWLARQLKYQWEHAAWKFGPLKIQPSLVISQAGYDSNLYYANDGQTADFGLTAGPAFQVYAPIKNKILLSIYESPQYVYFFESARERTWNNYLKAEVDFLFNRMALSAGYGLIDARIKWNSEIDIRLRGKEKNLWASLLWQESPKTSISIRLKTTSYEYESVEFLASDIRQSLNRREDYLNAIGYYQVTPRLRFFVDGEYGTYKFDNPQASGDSRSYAVYGGFEFEPLGKIRGRVRLGTKWFRFVRVGMPNFQGLVGDTSVSVSLARNLNLRASYKRDVQFSVWEFVPYFVENWTGGGASVYFFKRKIRLDYDYNRGTNTYGSSAADTRSGGTYVYETNSVGLYYRLKQNIGMGITAGRFVRTSNLAEARTNRNFAGLNLTYDF